MVPELRARGIGELLDAAVAIYRVRFVRLVAVTATVIVPVQVLTAIIFLSSQPSGFGLSFSGTPQPRYTSGDAAAELGATFAVLALSVISRAFVVAVCTRIAANAYVDHGESNGESIRVGGRRFFAVLGVTIVVTVAQVVGVFACIVGVIVPIVFFSVAVPALLLEQIGVFRSLGRSIELTKSSFGHVLGLVVASQLLAGVLQFGLTALVGGVFGGGSSSTLGVAQSIATAISATITYPFLAAATVALYFDLRVRREGFDVQLMMQRLDTRRAPAPVPT